MLQALSLATPAGGFGRLRERTGFVRLCHRVPAVSLSGPDLHLLEYRSVSAQWLHKSIIATLDGIDPSGPSLPRPGLLTQRRLRPRSIARGNAADAAVAAAAAVSVTEPLLSSIGGGGFALVRYPEWRGRAHRLLRRDAGQGIAGAAFGAGGSPQTVVLKYGAGVNSTVGGAAVAVPGALRGWEASARPSREAHARGDARPAVKFAREGFRLCKTSGCGSRSPKRSCGLPTRRGRTSTRRPGLPRGRRDAVPRARGHAGGHRRGRSGTHVRRRARAALSGYVLKMGGIITEQDLAEYRAVIREPLAVAYGQW